MRAQLPSPPCPPAELPLPQTSTLRSRRRLANILVTAGFIYMLCWLPHVWCLVITEFSINEGCSNTAREFFMLLGEFKAKSIVSRCIRFSKIYYFQTGFTHSAVSPIIHWVLNYNSLRQSACQPFAKLNSAQRFLRSHLRFTGPPAAPPSSTNEAALGPFNPKFIKQRPQIYKPPASSHYLYWIYILISNNVIEFKHGLLHDPLDRYLSVNRVNSWLNLCTFFCRWDIP